MQAPTGLGNGQFTYADLLLTIQQSGWTTTVYFPGSNDIICEASVLDPAVQWCAPKEAPVNTFAWEGVQVVHHVPGAPPTVTPEPGLEFFCLVMVLVIILVRNLRKVE